MYNIAANVDLLTELASQLREKRSALEAQIDAIYNEINNMHSHWTGKSYATFSSECYSYASSLQALVTMLEAFAMLFEGEVTGNAETYIKAAEEAFNVIG